MLKNLKKAFGFLASYQLSCVLFVLLLLLTYLGTVSQVEQGLFQAQKKYFESIVLVHYIYGVMPIILPGGYLLLVVLFVNITCGGIIRARRGWASIGSIITHAGILILLIGAFVAYRYSINGNLTLYEGEKSDLFQSYQEWEISVSEAPGSGTVTEFVIDEKDFTRARSGSPKTFRFPNVPFELTVVNYLENCAKMPAPKSADAAAVTMLAALPLEKEAERNVAGADIVVKEPSGPERPAALWGQSSAPFTVDAAGKKWNISLHHRQWQLPFTVLLAKFKRELHPRTNMPSQFSSDVVKIEGNVNQPYKISMNEPLRHRGYTLYQSSWGPPGAGPNDRLYSTLAVVKNPADKLPLYSCIVISLGMTINFGQKLIRYLKKESAKHA